MKITKNFKGLRKTENGSYVYDGDLISDEDIKIELVGSFICTGTMKSAKAIITNCRIIVKKNIEAGYGIVVGYDIKAGGSIKASYGIVVKYSIEAGEDIETANYIEAGFGINAGRNIKVGWGINAGWGIKAGGDINVGMRIFAGISSTQSAEECDKRIVCRKLVSGEIAYGDLEEEK